MANFPWGTRPSVCLKARIEDARNSGTRQAKRARAA